MKERIMFFCFSLITITSYSQIFLFGVDLDKVVNYGNEISYKKIKCSNNLFYSLAEYKNMLDEKFILFENYDVKTLTMQMKNPEKYLGNLRDYINKNFCKNIPIYIDSDLKREFSGQFFWIKKHQSKYLVAKLFYNNVSKENDFNIYLILENL